MACEHLRWQNVPREQLNPLLARQVVSGKKAMLARFYLRKGCVVPSHSHESEQLSYILEGALRFRLESQKNPEGQKEAEAAEELVVRAGEVLVIPSHLVHSAVALEDTVALDIFSPIRQDWLDGSDAYLRK